MGRCAATSLLWVAAACGTPGPAGGGGPAAGAGDSGAGGELGASPVPTCDLLAGPYVLDLRAARFTAPAGVSDLFAAQLDHDPMLEVVATGPGQLDVLWAWSEGRTQDPCQPTAGPHPATSWASPFFELEARKLLLRAGGGHAVVEDVHLEGRFAPDCSWLGGGVLTAVLDTRQQLDWAGPALDVQTADGLCDALTGFGVACQPCADGQAYCVDVRADQVRGERVSGTAVPITDADIAADPACAAR